MVLLVFIIWVVDIREWLGLHTQTEHTQFLFQIQIFLITMIILCSIVLFLAALANASQSSVQLTRANYEEKTKGKTVFIKMFSPE